MATQTRQLFTKGINRRFSREDSVSPEFFWSLQNARLFSRGDTGKVRRIEGFTKFNTGNSTDYTNILDIINWKDKFIVFFQDAVTSTTFQLDVYSEDGTRDFTGTYTGSDISQGSLEQSEDTIFIEPHNKILYWDGSSWRIEDYISETPSLAAVQKGTANAASGTIEPTSSPSSSAGRKAQGAIHVSANNTPVDQQDSLTVTVKDDLGNNYTTGTVNVNYEDSVIDIAQNIYDALVAVTGITDHWDVSMSQTQPSKKLNSSTIYLTAASIGTNFNGDKISIDGSSYFIIDKDDDKDPDSDVGKGDPFFRVYDGEATESNDVIFSNPESLEKRLNTTTFIVQPNGGQDSLTDLGPLYLHILSPLGITVETENITTSDTAANVATKIETALNGNTEISDNYNVNKSLNEITLTANKFGKEWNSPVKLRFKLPQFVDAEDYVSFTKTDLTGGTEVDTANSLKPHTNYWYTARYRYLDGHVTKTALPKLVNTGALHSAELTIQTPATDLDGNKPKLQIFRREEGGNFFLIDEVTPSGATHTFEDTGSHPIDVLQEKDLVWTKSHKAQTVIEDHYVRGNIEYFNEIYTAGSFNLNTTTSTDDHIIPVNSKVSVYMQPRYTDGTEGYHTRIGVLDVKTDDQKLTVEQTALASAGDSDKSIDEIAYFANYMPHEEKFFFKFGCPEIANKNISTIADRNLKPAATRILFGFKYLELWGTDSLGVFKVFGWDGGENEPHNHGGFEYGVIDDTGPIGTSFPREVTINVFGQDFKYVRIGYRDATGGVEGSTENAVYKLDMFEALEQAVSTGKLRVRLADSEIKSLSTTEDNRDLFKAEVNVTNLIDKSSQYKELNIRTEKDTVLIGPHDSRIYLELEESILDEIDNTDLNRFDLRRNYKAQNRQFVLMDGFPTQTVNTKTYNLSFELLNFTEKNAASMNDYTGVNAANDGGRPLPGPYNTTFYVYEWDFADFKLSDYNLIDDSELLIYLGTKANQDDTGTPVTLDITGYNKEEESSLIHAELQEFNIFDTLVKKSDVNLNKTSFENQLVWSEKLVTGSGFAGGRTLKTDAFLNIPSEYGSIIGLEDLQDRLYIFCEQGIAIAPIGEVLAQSGDGRIEIQTENFLPDQFFIFTELQDIKRDSIQKVKNSIIFTDGYDVYSLTRKGVENLTNGLLSLDSDNDFSATIDLVNQEYKLSDVTNSETWVYNFEFGQWYGPFTYVAEKGSNYKNTVISNNGTDLIKHNTGNDFNGTSFTTLIQSVANDTESSFFDKTYRKFYLGVNNNSTSTFKYGKDFNNLISRDIGAAKSKQGYEYIGVQPDQQNSKIIYWEISTQDDGFELADIGWRFMPKRRR